MTRRFSFGALLLLAGFLASPDAEAASRTFTATLTKVADCSIAAPSGSASLTIDDQSGAVTGSLVITGFGAATVASAGIHNAAAGDNLVGGFDGVATDAPNATHAVTTTLNSIALPKILAGDGAVIVKSSATGCGPGAIRGALVESSAAADAGVDAGEPSVADAGSSGPVTQPKDAGVPSGGSSPPSEESTDDGGCAQAPGTSLSLASALGAFLALGFVRLGRRTRRRG